MKSEKKELNVSGLKNSMWNKQNTGLYTRYVLARVRYYFYCHQNNRQNGSISHPVCYLHHHHCHNAKTLIQVITDTG